MALDLTESNQILKKFAKVLTEYQSSIIRGYDEQDPFQLVQEFRSIAGEAALDYVRLIEEDQNKIKFTNFELEAKLWSLVELLVSFRISDDSPAEVVPHSYKSDAVFKKELLQKDRALYEIWLIISWIQENLTIPPRPESLPTTKWSHSMLSGGIKSNDLDYPLREGSASIDPKDLEDDHQFYRFIYELILAGEYDEVRRECEYSDNLTLSMIMCGLEDYVDPKKDIELAQNCDSHQGIKKHALWRRAVYVLSQNPNLDKYEAAIYKFLAGTIPDGLDAGDVDWDKELLVYLNEIWNIRIENYLLERGRVDKEELITAMPSEPLSLENVLNIVASKNPEESEHPIRVLMGSVILNTISPVIKSFNDILSDVVKGVDCESELLLEPYLLRILTHLVIFLDKTCPELIKESEKSRLITTYVTLLTLYEQHELIPVYISFLNADYAMDVYSYFLSNLRNPKNRERQLELCHFLQLPTANILRKTGQRIFNDTESHYNPSEVIAVNFEVTEIDRCLMSAVDWLLEGRLHSDSVDSIIALCRRFLINGKVKSLENFFDNHKIDDIIKNYELDMLAAREENPEDRFVQEITQYSNFVNVFKRYNEWEDTCKAYTIDSNLPTVLKQFKALSNSLRHLVTTFLVDLTENAETDNSDNDILHSIRSLYIPYMIIELHMCYMEAATKFKIDSFIQEAIRLSVLVANETEKIYLLFQSSGKLREYLQLVAKAITISGH
ncbi:Nup84p Ecym_3365 [Eremothecium cymbalariae DBVPG|uniref:Nuclear pore complex protein n=1 Tax=Eremothecium cymbalariae (strain CBS 270.75 / DBVPG 7215 / KCTC 17166 / NRRL Y-17582) TaxID=931890 RepID=G8JRT3_ERECY|nr:Hypothetical protein Ecym_3365 [Eremothecium cymbalariae DBVPG\